MVHFFSAKTTTDLAKTSIQKCFETHESKNKHRIKNDIPHELF